MDALTRVSDGTRALQEAKTAFEALRIADAAEAYRYMMKMAGASEGAQREASTLKLRAERRAGELLRDMPKQEPGQYQQRSEGATVAPTYAEQGIDKRVAARCQKIARIPEERFEEFLAVADEITNTGIERVANEIDRFSEQLETPALPKAKYRILYADPPWSYGNEQHVTRGEVQETVLASHYPSMSIDQLCALPVRDLVNGDAVLFLWVPSPQLEDSFRLIHAWGFEYKTSMVWDKIKHNVGNYVSVRHEFLLICTRGSCTPDARKLVDSVYPEERTEHSKKPEYFREVIDMLYPNGKAIELFRRGQKVGRWDVWGDEAK